MYGTRPWCLVQAITRYTCQDPHLGSWNCLPHQAHIAPSEPMSSTDQQGSSSLPLIPTLIGLRAFDLVSSPVWWEAATNSPQMLPLWWIFQFRKKRERLDPLNIKKEPLYNFAFLWTLWIRNAKIAAQIF